MCNSIWGSLSFGKAFAFAVRLALVTPIASAILAVPAVYAQEEYLLFERNPASAVPDQRTIPVPLAFDVASIRQVLVNCGTGEGSRFSGSVLMLKCNRNIDLVSEAYNLRDYQVSMPGDLERAEWDIEAKANMDRVLTKAEFRQMLQSLLADRFKLRVHRETREMPVYVLSAGRGGPKFKQSSNPDAPYGLQEVQRVGRDLRIKTSVSMEDFTITLIRYLGPERPIVNETGLTGRYDIALEAAMFSNRDPEPGDLSIFTAVQEQLGLKLEVQKRPVEFLVVDHMEKPSEN